MKIGKIVAVEFDRFRVKLFQTTKTSVTSITGDVYYFGNIGSYLKTKNIEGNYIICEVISVMDYVTQDTYNSPYNLDTSKEFVIKPIGTLDKKRVFSMGVGIFPSLYSDVEIVTKDDLGAILAMKESQCIEEGVHKSICVGESKSMINYNVHLNIDTFFNIHTAILGNSGSGKSNTIAHILQEVYRKDCNYALGAKTIIFDANGEYRKAFSKGVHEKIEVKCYKPNIESNEEQDKFILPYYLMNLDEWLGFLIASEKTQKPFWDKVLQETYKFYKIFTDTSGKDYLNYFKWKIWSILNLVMSQVDSDTARVTAARSVILRCQSILLSAGSDKFDNLIEFLKGSLDQCTIQYGDNKDKLARFLKEQKETINEEEALEINALKLRSGDFYDYSFLQTAVEMTLLEEEARGNSRIREFAATMLTRLDYFLNNPECEFMRELDTKFDNPKEYLSHTLGITSTKSSSQLIIIDTSEVNTDTLELLTNVISRMIFDYRKSLIGDERRKNPVHLIMDEAHRYIRKDAEYILRNNIFEQIAREGRKYSLFLILSSQRPSELSPTVLSQCGNYIVHRIQNELDMKYIYSVLPYFSEDFVTKIKQSVPGEALIFGNCVPMPLQIKVHRPCPDPNSENCIVSKEWFKKS